MKKVLALILGLVALGAVAAPAEAQTYFYTYGVPYGTPLGHNFIGYRDRGILRDYMVNEHARRCAENETRGLEPCGLASRSVRYYTPGSVLPSWVYDTAVPMGVQAYLTPPPVGAAYVYADDNVYMIDVLSRRILDVVSMPTD